MDIRLISSLTDADEGRFAPVLLKAMADLLSTIPIAYSVRIKTTQGKIFHRSCTAPEAPASTLAQFEEN